MTLTYNGLGRNLGNLSWISEAHTRSISAENPTGGKGMGAMADPEPDGPAARAGAWLEGAAPMSSSARRRRPSWRTSTGPGAIQSMWFGGSIMTRDFILRIYWEGAGAALGRDAAHRLLRHAVQLPEPGTPDPGAHHPDQFAAGGGQPQPCSQLLLGDAVPPARQDHDREPPPDAQRRLLLPGQLLPDRRARTGRLLPCPVPPHQSAALPAALHDPRRRPGPRPLRRHLHGHQHQQQRLVGRRRDQVLHRRRRRISDHLRHRHRGLLRRRLQL